jgi:two-component system response regulator WspF
MLRIAVVNDSVMANEALQRIVRRVPEYQLLWAAYNGREAVEKCADQCPDIVLMDLVMPEMNGVEATRTICARFDCAILIVTATVEGNSGLVFEAMGAGALDAVNTPVLGAGGDGEDAGSLIRKINTIATLLHGRPYRGRLAPTPPRAGPVEEQTVPVIAIGASTGGPSALRTVLHALPADAGAAIAIVQHVDQQFAASFISWLDQAAPMPVRMARPGDRLERGTALVCGREEHLVLTPGGEMDYSAQPHQLVFRPSVDVFFASLAQNHTNQAVGVLLTGMGRDGAVGLKAMRERGWTTIAQDQTTSAVYGMPKAAMELGAAGTILPLDDIGPALAQWVTRISRATLETEDQDER